MELLSTGQVSKRLSVTPDTILKWIKRGKLPALRTAGGHYRISPKDIQALQHHTGKAFSHIPPASLKKKLIYCWEFFADKKRIRERCQNCLVYRAQAHRCFEMNHLPQGLGFHGGKSCVSCEKCAYFRYHQGLPFNVLVITDNKACRESIQNKGESYRINLQFASCEYESSLLVGQFQPDFIVVDCTMQEDKCRELCHHLASDPRIPENTVILATPPRKTPLSLPGTLRMGYPFSIRDLENFLRENQACPSIWT